MIKKTILQYFTLTMLFNFAMCSIVATYVTFLTSNGLNLFEVNMVNFVFFSVRLIFEIPTGAFADVFGRKASFVMSCLLMSLGTFMYALSHSFWGFAAAEGVSAVGSTFASGAFDAWLVDKLNHHGHTGERHRIFARAEFLGRVVGIASALIGSYLADIRGSLPWFLGSAIFLVTGIVTICWMKEEYFEKQPFSWSLGLTSMKNTFLSSVEYGIKNKVVRFIVIVGLIQMFAVQAPNMQWQPYFIQFVHAKRNLGYMWVVMSSFLMIGSMIAPRLLTRVKDEKKSLVICQVIAGLGILLTTLVPFLAGIMIYMVHEIPRGMYGPLKKKYLHDNIPSKERATIASFESISPHLGGMAGLLLSGFLANTYSISLAWVTSGVVLIGATLLVAKNGVKK